MYLGMPGDQSLGYGILAIDRRSPIGYSWLAGPGAPLPLGPDCDLSWLGFTDEGMAVTLDSSGLMQLQPKPGIWFPLLDTRQNIKGFTFSFFFRGISN